MREILSEIFLAAVLAMGAPEGMPRPDVLIMQDEHLQALWCEETPNCGSPLALFWSDTPTLIYIREDLDFVTDKFSQTVLFHEYVHFLQHIAEPELQYTCEARQERELEALQKQFVYAVQLGIGNDMRFQVMKWHYTRMCLE